MWASFVSNPSLPLYSYILHRCLGNPLYCEVLCQDLLSKDILLFHAVQKEEEEEENSEWETLSGKLSFPGVDPGPAAGIHVKMALPSPYKTHTYSLLALSARLGLPGLVHSANNM